jgi:hypothetical protein
MAGLGKQFKGTGIARVGLAEGSFPDLNKMEKYLSRCFKRQRSFKKASKP